MPVLDSLYHASFKGFKFLFLNESATAGKKTISHEYPNSDIRFTEELGKIPHKFSMVVIIHGTIDKRIEFEDILSSEGFGQLIHPFYGVIDNVMSTTYTISSSQKEVGVFNFNINFEVSSTDFIHVVETINEQSISENSSDVCDEIYDDFSGSYVEPETVSGFQAAVESVTNTLEAIQTNIKNVINPIQEAAAEFNKIVNNVIGEVNDIIQSGKALKDTFSSVYISILNIVDLPNKLERFWNDLLSYGKVLDIPLSTSITASSKRNTVARIEIANNVSIIQEQVRLVALASIFESVAFKDMKTADEIIEAKEFLDIQYNTIINNSIDDSEEGSILLINNTILRNKFATLRNNTIEVLNDKLVNAWKIENINPGLNSFSLLSYKYYNNIDNVDTLINLNEDLNSSGFRHSVDILGA